MFPGTVSTDKRCNITIKESLCVVCSLLISVTYSQVVLAKDLRSGYVIFD